MRGRFCILCLLWVAGTGFVLSQPTKQAFPKLKSISVTELHDIILKDSGSVVLVNVWATWCKWCKAEMPSILKLKQKYAPKGLRLILVSADDIDGVESEVKPTLKKMGVNFPTYIMHDSTDEAFILGMNPKWSGALPTSFIYDQKGMLVEMLVGERTVKEFETKVTKYLK